MMTEEAIKKLGPQLAYNAGWNDCLEQERQRLDKAMELLQRVYDEHMQFGWGDEELHDLIIEFLGDKLKPVKE